MNLNSESSTIVNIPLSELHGNTLDITQKATPRRLRMIDCHAYVHEQVLRICQFNESGPTSYSAISYIWKGNGPITSSEPPPHQFRVKGAEDGDPVSIPVLGYACLISLHHALPYIWFDRACIMQTNKEDKNWQIKHMFELYKNAAVCVVLPGGMERLVPMDEETVWMHRGWTLQEALVPASTVVAFAWDRGGGVLHNR
ncbi:hypothetical protein ARMGADRAFT_916977, partial [Armillaria gallica]